MKKETVEEFKDLAYYKKNAEEDILSVSINVLRYISKLEQEVERKVKDLAYCKTNAEEDYLSVPISVLRYISELEKEVEIIYSEEEALNLIIECSKWLLPQTDEDLSKIKQWFDKVKKN